MYFFFFFSSRRRHTRLQGDWSSDVCSSDLSITGQRGEAQISDGKVDGDDISFAQVMEFNGNQVKLLFTGKVAGDEIKFTRQREGGDRKQEFTAKRAN